MATSGTYIYTITAANLILASLRLVNAYDPEDSNTSTANQQSNAAEALEMMLKAWGTKGLQLWERKYGAIFFQPGQAFYRLGGYGPAGDHACLTNPLGSGFVATHATSGAASGASTIVLDSINSSYSEGVAVSTITSGWNIGIEKDSGGLQWTTVSGSLTGNSVPLTATLTDTVSAGASIYAYQTKMMKPLRIYDCFIRQVNGNDSPVNTISRDTYNTFGQKSSQGTPVEIMVDQQRTYADIYFYPTPSNIDQYAYIELGAPIQDVSTTTNELDLPAEWIEAIKYNLALRIAPEYGLTEAKYKRIKELAMYTFNDLEGWDQENASVYFQPEKR